MKDFFYSILAGVIFLGLVAMVVVPVGALLFLANWIFGIGGETSDAQLSSRKTPTHEGRTIGECHDAVSQQFAAIGYDVFRFAETPKVAYENADKLWQVDLSIPVRSADPVTGRNDRTLWVNAVCTVSATGTATLHVQDLAGLP